MTPTSSPIALKKGSWQLTQEAKDEFERKFRALEDDKKWKLRDGVYVEDVMYKFGMKCTHEHPVHSFILNVDDKCWEEESDFTPEDISAIRTFGNYAFPPISDNLNALFAAYKGHPQVDALGFLVEKTNMLGPYDPRTHPDEYKIHHGLQQFVGYYVDDVFAGVESWSEQDFVTHVWSVFDRFFHPLQVTTLRDHTCEATSQRVNSDRAVTGSSEIKDKKRFIRPDLVLLKDGLEYGCSELGKNLRTVSDKKEIIETRLHSPKTMKDMLCSAIAKADNDEQVARTLKIVCFNDTSLSMSLSVMDCPKGYVTRIISSKTYEVPRAPELMVPRLFPIFKLALKAKIIVENSLATIGQHLFKDQEPELVFETTSPKLALPPCLTASILPITRKRKQGRSESLSSSSKRPANTVGKKYSKSM